MFGQFDRENEFPLELGVPYFQIPNAYCILLLWGQAWQLGDFFLDRSRLMLKNILLRLVEVRLRQRNAWHSWLSNHQWEFQDPKMEVR